MVASIILIQAWSLWLLISFYPYFLNLVTLISSACKVLMVNVKCWDVLLSELSRIHWAVAEVYDSITDFVLVRHLAFEISQLSRPMSYVILLSNLRYYSMTFYLINGRICNICNGSLIKLI